MQRYLSPHKARVLLEVAFAVNVTHTQRLRRLIKAPRVYLVATHRSGLIPRPSTVFRRPAADLVLLWKYTALSPPASKDGRPSNVD